MGQRHTSASSVYGVSESGDRGGDDESDGLLNNDDAEDGQDGHGSAARSSASSESGVQEGVLKIEAISKTWSRRSLVVAYLGYVWFSSP
jgi:hypothetical protein